MNQHSQISDLLPLYVSGALRREQRNAVEEHLARCAECRADLGLWQSIAEEIVAGDRAMAAPPHRLLNQALVRIRGTQPATIQPSSHVHPSSKARLSQVIQLIRAQVPLVQREIWPASAAVIGLGFIAALLASHAGFVYALAPLTAATCLALIYGPENDPAYELALSTPTSPRQILLARFVLVFGYNLGLVLAASLGLLLALGQPLPDLLWGEIVLAWLAPMTFLSAAALALSVWLGASNAIGIAYAAWLVHLLAGWLGSPYAVLNLSGPVLDWMAIYQQFWQTPVLLLGLSALLSAAAIWLAGQPGQRQYLSH